MNVSGRFAEFGGRDLAADIEWTRSFISRLLGRARSGDRSLAPRIDELERWLVTFEVWESQDSQRRATIEGIVDTAIAWEVAANKAREQDRRLRMTPRPGASESMDALHARLRALLEARQAHLDSGKPATHWPKYLLAADDEVDRGLQSLDALHGRTPCRECDALRSLQARQRPRRSSQTPRPASRGASLWGGRTEPTPDDDWAWWREQE